MGGFPKRFTDANDSSVEFLLTDLDTALTFMDVARVTGNEESAKRNHNNARNAYETVLRLLPLVRPDSEQRKAITDKLALLRSRLEAVGFKF